ncbi:homodimeric glycerol 3-phosphate dehydrogenase (quinone) [Rhodovulum imhoffii]|uniref:Glycerol-3-phosphate dehydrogenase n=1 Tax=Rhodovulum imhoffii TaxID=365340 RepID=A0A2T5BRB9_9RHOB|nr:glycerol-3-phosphate dehydrogenase [Rhodovulum imhoffii]MBK5934456.1 glycerol-3-phosphate dehydrogenase [Rhodovulum imhoffii]PTN01803.1 homodimeric glycerol 3-phosphate dehydrogenase (quinone) [Rhodovulum imhoffii]
MPQAEAPQAYDLFVIGGGINGCGIARDAAGRGLRVGLAEQGDLAQATSSASTKLFHGGLRYLEYFEIRLVREALIERETLLSAMPHISWPMRFVLPYHGNMRFDSDTPTSRLMSLAMPWMKGRRPAWLLRAGLAIYDWLGGREILPPTRVLALPGTVEGAPLKREFGRAFEYSDCWVDDARLVVLNARDAQTRGAEVLVRTRVEKARRDGAVWVIALRDGDTGALREVRARMLVNAAGPWVGDVLHGRLNLQTREGVRLVRGSHIVVRKLFEHDKAYFLQGEDGRIVFVIPYEQEFTLIGTTDRDHPDPGTPPVCTEAEQEYLCAFVTRYFRRPVTREDIVWTYSGVRPLYDDGASSATAATRDYTLTVDSAGAPLLNVFGGKITTYRRLAESAMERIAPFFQGVAGGWTAGVPLPGGDFPVDGASALVVRLRQDYPFLTGAWALRLVRAYGTEAWDVLGRAHKAGDLGEDFGATLTERELCWLVGREFARSAEDVLWRRSKLGLRLDAAATARLEEWIDGHLRRRAAAE